MLFAIWNILFLIICTITDLKEKKIYVWFSVINFILAFLIHIFISDVKIILLVGGIIVGIIFYVISLVSKDAIGKGDGILILVLGCLVGIKKQIEILIWAFLICTVFFILTMIIKRKEFKKSVPFSPFLLLG